MSAVVVGGDAYISLMIPFHRVGNRRFFCICLCVSASWFLLFSVDDGGFIYIFLIMCGPWVRDFRESDRLIILTTLARMVITFETAVSRAMISRECSCKHHKYCQ